MASIAHARLRMHNNVKEAAKRHPRCVFIEEVLDRLEALPKLDFGDDILFEGQ